MICAYVCAGLPGAAGDCCHPAAPKTCVLTKPASRFVMMPVVPLCHICAGGSYPLLLMQQEGFAGSLGLELRGEF
jgi:hypothetical protein